MADSELLSAYLDGELAAAERADVQRLLAADSAARRELDELRAVSAAVQTLPRQTLDEDLTRTVLRIAERRMLMEAPVAGRPSLEPARSLRERFLSRHNLVWLAITASIALLITLFGQQHPTLNHGGSNRDVAQNQRGFENERRGAETANQRQPEAIQPGQPGRDVEPSIQAWPEKPEKATAGLPQGTKAPHGGNGSDYASPAPGTRQGPPSVESQGGGALANTNQQAGQGVGSALSGQTPGATSSSTKPGPLATPDTKPRPVVAPDGTQGTVKSAAPAATAVYNEATLFVNCDLTPDAAKDKAFEKLLDAVGITYPKPANPDAPLASEWGPVSVPVDATEAQVNAAVAGLQAQPELFPAITVKRVVTQPKKAVDTKAAQAKDAKATTKQPKQPPTRQKAVFVLRIVTAK